MRHTNRFVLPGSLLLLATTAVHAQGAPDSVRSNELRLGAYFVEYSVKADDFSGPFTPPGLNADLENVTTLYVGYIRRLSEHFNVEFAFGVPPKTTTVAKGPAFVGSVPFNGEKILTARWLSPSILFNYLFFHDDSRIRPYLGIGINHTIFMERRITDAGLAIVGGPTRVELPSSTGVAGTAGVSLRVTDRLHVYGSYSMAQVKSRLTTNTLGIIRSTNVDFGPRTWVVSVGYSF